MTKAFERKASRLADLDNSVKNTESLLTPELIALAKSSCELIPE